MKEQAPELFENDPDLMHHLATILSPAVLMKHGIPVRLCNTYASAFVYVVIHTLVLLCMYVAHDFKLHLPEPPVSSYVRPTAYLVAPCTQSLKHAFFGLP